MSRGFPLNEQDRENWLARAPDEFILTLLVLIKQEEHIIANIATIIDSDETLKLMPMPRIGVISQSRDETVHDLVIAMLKSTERINKILETGADYVKRIRGSISDGLDQASSDQ
jgi:hypothetical protein